MPFPSTPDTRPCKHGHVSARDRQGKCPECRVRWDAKFAGENPGYHKKYLEDYRAAGAEKYMLWGARERARKGGYVCTITVHDIVIPKFCPLLGIELKRGTGAGGVISSSPTLDKINPILGYVPGNIWVISARANTLKNDATLQELRMLVDNLTKAVQKFPWEAS